MDSEKVERIQRKDSTNSRLNDFKNEDQYEKDAHKYEHIIDVYQTLEVSENMIETENTENQDPDYYYYYYFDYTDPDIVRDTDSYEPLPTPLW